MIDLDKRIELVCQHQGRYYGIIDPDKDMGLFAYQSRDNQNLVVISAVDTLVKVERCAPKRMTEWYKKDPHEEDSWTIDEPAIPLSVDYRGQTLHYLVCFNPQRMGKTMERIEPLGPSTLYLTARKLVDHLYPVPGTEIAGLQENNFWLELSATSRQAKSNLPNGYQSVGPYIIDPNGLRYIAKPITKEVKSRFGFNDKFIVDDKVYSFDPKVKVTLQNWRKSDAEMYDQARNSLDKMIRNWIKAKVHGVLWRGQVHGGWLYRSDPYFF